MSREPRQSYVVGSKRPLYLRPGRPLLELERRNPRQIIYLHEIRRNRIKAASFPRSFRLRATCV